jgi:hypothetical protein
MRAMNKLILFILYWLWCAGTPSIFIVYVLRALKLERGPKVWTALAVIALVWAGFALWLGYKLIIEAVNVEGKGMGGLGLAIKDIPIWLFCFFPSFPVLVALVWKRPEFSASKPQPALS